MSSIGTRAIALAAILVTAGLYVHAQSPGASLTIQLAVPGPSKQASVILDGKVLFEGLTPVPENPDTGAAVMRLGTFGFAPGSRHHLVASIQGTTAELAWVTSMAPPAWVVIRHYGGRPGTDEPRITFAIQNGPVAGK
ncbi:MAG: hypothetical protein GC151_18455 [Betaproteobacteria bacterium]|nr:hypothetical protein [Betaproteobacteria bacterium]